MFNYSLNGLQGTLLIVQTLKIIYLFNAKIKVDDNSVLLCYVKLLNILYMVNYLLFVIFCPILKNNNLFEHLMLYTCIYFYNFY